MDALLVRRCMQVVWPAFSTAAGSGSSSSSRIFDPFELHFFGQPLDWSREGIYALGFFGFWGLGIASSTLSLFLAQTSEPDIAPLED
jgi:hypothetical protein